MSINTRKGILSTVTYNNDGGLKEKLSQSETFYNFERPYGTYKGKTPFEILKI